MACSWATPCIWPDPKTGKPPEDLEKEIHLLLDGIKDTLAQAGTTMDDLVHVQVFCPDLSLYDKFNGTCREPSRTILACVLGARDWAIASILFGRCLPPGLPLNCLILSMNQRLKADVALALCTVLWGATFVVVKGALADASVFAFMGVRFVLAALLMAVIYRRSLRQLTGAEVWAGAQIGFFMFTGYAFQTLGLSRTTPSKAGFITGFGVVLVPVLMALFWGRRVNRWVWGGALAAVVGLYYLTVPEGGFAYLNVGDLLVFVCAVLFALHIIYVGRYSPYHSVGALSFLQVATTAVLTLVALPVASVTGWEPLRVHWTAELLFAVLITAGLATALAFSVQVWAQQYTTPTHTAILFSLEPVFAAFTSYVMLGERLGGRALVGAGLILVGILVAEVKGPTQAAPDSPGPVTESVESGSTEKPQFI